MRILTVVVLLLVTAAADADSGSDACAILSDTIYRQVAAVGRDGRRTASFPRRFSAPAVCSATARAVSKGFTRAMAEQNLYITWSTPEHQLGDICLSHDLSQCYPNQNPFVPQLSLYDAAYIVQQWQQVQATISASMPAGTGSDVSQFDPAVIGVQMQRDLGRESGRRYLPD